MKRREFLGAGLGAGLAASAALVAERAGLAQTAATGKPRQYYELRKYLLQTGPQVQGAAEYVGKALIPALNRVGIAPVGAFNLQIGPETPALYLLLPSTNLETLVNARLRLEQDEAFQAAAVSFWNAPATSPAFVRVESTLLIAFAGWPEITVPPRRSRRRSGSFRCGRMRVRACAIMRVRCRCFTRGSLRFFARRGSGMSFSATR